MEGFRSCCTFAAAHSSRNLDDLGGGTATFGGHWVVLEERTTSLAELLSVQNFNELRLSVSPNRYTSDRKKKRVALVKIGEVTSCTSEGVRHTPLERHNKQLGDDR